MNDSLDKLINPVWYSLSEAQKEYTLDFGDTKFYQPVYAAFGSFNRDCDPIAIQKYAQLTSKFLMVGEEPLLPNSVKLNKKLEGVQMLIENSIHFAIEEEIVHLTSYHLPELLELVALVYPAYYQPKTFYLGDYYGIFKNNKLVAITGERMQMDAFVEISAVITHPDYTGRGYAKQLVAHTVNKIIAKNKTPFLHTESYNVGAIGLYNKLGFRKCRNMNFWILERR